jgi:hypothetical protein
VEVELSGNVPSASQNLLLDTSTANDLNAIASSFTTGSYDSPSIVSSASSQPPAAAAGGKKESHLFGWFASSTSTSAASSAAHNASVTSTSSSAATASPQTVATRPNLDTNGEAASPPSTKLSSKLSYGEMFKFNKNGNKASAMEQPAVDAPQPPSAGQKSSRRTTSLLNLFMSNSQGKKYNKNTENIYTFNSRVFSLQPPTERGGDSFGFFI